MLILFSSRYNSKIFEPEKVEKKRKSCIQLRNIDVNVYGIIQREMSYSEFPRWSRNVGSYNPSHYFLISSDVRSASVRLPLCRSA